MWEGDFRERAEFCGRRRRLFRKEATVDCFANWKKDKSNNKEYDKCNADPFENGSCRLSCLGKASHTYWEIRNSNIEIRNVLKIIILVICICFGFRALIFDFTGVTLSIDSAYVKIKP